MDDRKVSIKAMTPKEKRVNFTYMALALIIAIIFLFPLYWLIQFSFKTDQEAFGKVLTFYPHHFTVEPWLTNLTDHEFLSSLKNSAIIGILTLTISMVFGVPTAYGLGRYKVKGHAIFVLVFLTSQMLPASVSLTPLYLTFSKLGLLNSYFAPPIAIASGSIAYIVVTLRPYFKTIPTALDDAARIDGANVLQAFFRIMIPTIKTGLVTCGVISFLNGWNDLILSMTFNVKDGMRPLTANIRKFQSKYGTKWNCIMAYGTILALPVVLLFIFFQKYIVGGMTAGSVKE